MDRQMRDIVPVLTDPITSGNDSFDRDSSQDEPKSLESTISTNADIVSTESSTTVEDDDGAGQWLHKTAAARIMGCAVTTIIRRGEAGYLPVRNKNGQKLYYVLTKGAAKALLADRRRSSEDVLAAAILRLHVMEKKSVLEICVQLECLPSFVARQITAYQQASEAALSLEKQQRVQETDRRAYELITGNVNIPTTWAWIAARIEASSSYADTKDSLEQWMKYAEGETEPSIVSPLVRAALASEVAWITTCTLWMRHEKANAERYIVDEQARQGFQMRHQLVEIWEKEQRYIQASERNLRDQQREDDRHGRETERKNKRGEGRSLGGNAGAGMKPPKPTSSPFGGDSEI